MSDEDKNERARELEKRLRGDADGDLKKTLAGLADAMKSCVDSMSNLNDAMDGLHRRVDAIEGKKPRRDAFAHQPNEDLDGDQDIIFDNLPDEEREKLISLQEEREPGKSRPVVADSARSSYDEMLRGETPHERERRRESLRFDVMARADAVFSELGLRCPPPSAIEPLTTYRHRLAKALARYSPTYKQVEISDLKGRALDTCEAVVYADSRRFAKAPTDVMPGQLRKVEKRQPGGHMIVEYFGSPSSWMDSFAGPVQLRGTGSFRVPNGGWGE